MFLFQIDGNDYIKKDYNEDGELENYQEFNVGRIRKESEKYIMPLKIYSYNEAGELEDSMITTYTCIPSQKEVMMMVFPYVGGGSDKTITVDLHRGNELYPVDPEVGQRVGNLVFSFSVEGGVLGAFGATSTVTVHNRKVIARDANRKTITLKGDVKVEAFLYGYRISTIKYSIKEVLHLKKGILKQRFENGEGGYFMISLED